MVVRKPSFFDQSTPPALPPEEAERKTRLTPITRLTPRQSHRCRSLLQKHEKALLSKKWTTTTTTYLIFDDMKIRGSYNVIFYLKESDRLLYSHRFFGFSTSRTSPALPPGESVTQTRSTVKL
jgi:hypothetical protein